MVAAAGDRRFLFVALLGSTLFRFAGWLWPLKPDESGFLLVSRAWDPTADSLFGPLFVDRPPLLIGLFRLADQLGGAYAPRVASALVGLLLVYAAYRIGLLLGGVTGARWTTVAAVALAAQPDLELWAGKSESLGAPLVLASCWLSIEALFVTERRMRFAFAAGVAGALALGMKQNLGGGAVFGVVLLVMALRTRRLEPGQALRVGIAAIAGFAVPVVAVLIWARAAGVQLPVLWDTLYGFRGDAFKVITSSSMAAPRERLLELGLFFVGTGLAALLGWFVVRFKAALGAHREVAAATAVMVFVDAVGLLLGGSYWTPYLTALVPGAVLVVAILVEASPESARRGMRVATRFAVASAVVLGVGWTAGHLLGRAAPDAHYIGEAVGEAASPGDTIVVLYGRADIVLASGLGTPYEHLWSLPARTLDPGLEQLRGVMAGEDAPTWVVEWIPVNSWDVDDRGELQALLDERYVAAGELCGRPVLLLRGEARQALPEVDCDRPWR